MAEFDYDYEYLAQLVRKAQKNNSEAFAELYAATYRKQYGFVYQYVKDTCLAQDVLQEVYIVVFKNIKRLNDPYLFISWLSRITFRVCFQMHKKRIREEQELKKNEDVEHILQEAEIEYDYPGRNIMKEQEREEVMKKVLSLPMKESQVIIMRFYNEMTLEEIAKAMGISRSTVQRYLAKGQRKLEKILKSTS